MRFIQVPIIALAAFVPLAAAQPGGPPAKVVLGKVTQGTLAPSTDLPGTVYFKEVSQLATEVGGKVVEVLFEEGQHLRKGDPMVRQDATLLKSELEAARFNVEQRKALLQQETVRLERAKQLLEDEVTTPQEFDDIRFTVESLRHNLDAAHATVTRLQEELEKKTTYAPYDGVVIDRETELGEWKRDGDIIAVYARDGVHDVIVNLPEAQLPYVETGMDVQVRVQDTSFSGQIVAIIPRADLATRTFPVKIRVNKQDWLLEGMSADVAVPRGDSTQSLMVPRDAVLTSRGEHLVYVIEDGKATQLPVTVLGYQDLEAAVTGNGLEAGTQVVVKGHERLRPGQAVEVMQ